MDYTKDQHNKPHQTISPALPLLSAAFKSVFIAGGSAGISKAAALAFLEAGSTSVALTGRREDVLASAAAELKAKFPGARVLTFAVDIADAEAMDAAFASARAEFGGRPLDVVVVDSTYYVPPPRPLLDVGLEQWWRAFEVNARGATILARCVAKHAAADAAVLHLSTSGSSAGLVTIEADFPKSKFVFAAWDVDELRARKDEIA
ncbi:hypothetical protein F4820DRAFT_445703 [Hypoxylon rubiginosum]|uniref:Uncharacterized protein n=1 Tax=Hypoxylon rubiginosum TaxID=110542 RepID=A0ACB9Z9P7_9PEZI|nr:hypothetical protein F4820DRAFT_445703 [Hypoxylon rubiginosum]